VTDGSRYSIDELADLGGVSRRTVRYYVQEDLLPAPLGVGRGRHYDIRHLNALQRVKAMQEAGQPLQAIRAALSGAAAPSAVSAGAVAPPSLRRTTWRRFELARGIELHVSTEMKLPAAHRIDELAAWCRQHLPLQPNEESR
jgi:DNA-binding transcriptional MerR regulator